MSKWLPNNWIEQSYTESGGFGKFFAFFVRQFTCQRSLLFKGSYWAQTTMRLLKKKNVSYALKPLDRKSCVWVQWLKRYYR